MRYGTACLLFAASTAFAQYTVTPQRIDPSGGVVVQIRDLNFQTLPACQGCPPLQISFGGVPSPKVTAVAAGYNAHSGWDVVAPPHEEGAVTITIGYGAFLIQKIERQFAYVVEREPVFVPVAADELAGSDGTLWSTELWVHNDGNSDVALLPAVTTNFDGISPWAGDRYVVAANSARRVPLKTSPWGLGTFLYPPAGAREQLSYDVRLVDRAHPGSGTSIPIVRLDAMRRAKLTMLNVPADSRRARRLLRIFAVYDSSYVVRVYDLDSGRQLAERTMDVSFPTDIPGPPTVVTTLNDDIIDGTASGATRLRVEVEQVRPPATHLFWAFISVTDNVTQQVTVIAPQ